MLSEACLSPQSLNGINHSISHNEEPANSLSHVPSIESTPDWVQVTSIQVPVQLPVYLDDLDQPKGVTSFCLWNGIRSCTTFLHWLGKPNNNVTIKVYGDLWAINNDTYMISIFVCFIKVNEIKGKHWIRKQMSRGWERRAADSEGWKVLGGGFVISGAWICFLWARPSSGWACKPPHKGSCYDVLEWWR